MRAEVTSHTVHACNMHAFTSLLNQQLQLRSDVHVLPDLLSIDQLCVLMLMRIVISVKQHMNGHTQLLELQQMSYPIMFVVKNFEVQEELVFSLLQAVLCRFALTLPRVPEIKPNPAFTTL